MNVCDVHLHAPRQEHTITKVTLNFVFDGTFWRMHRNLVFLEPTFPPKGFVAYVALNLDLWVFR